MDDSLKKYIKDSISAGLNKEQIVKQLKEKGWDSNNIEKTYNSLVSKSGQKITKNKIIIAIVVTLGFASIVIFLIYRQLTSSPIQTQLPDQQQMATGEETFSEAGRRLYPIEAETREADGFTLYTNDEFLISFKVPEGWSSGSFESKEVTQNPNDMVTVLAFDPDQILEDADAYNNFYFTVSVYDSSDASRYPIYQETIKPSEDSYERIQVGNKEGLNIGPVIYVLHEGYVYEIRMKTAFDQEGNRVYTDLSKQILNSFVFLPANQ